MIVLITTQTAIQWAPIIISGITTILMGIITVGLSGWYYKKTLKLSHRILLKEEVKTYKLFLHNTQDLFLDILNDLDSDKFQEKHNDALKQLQFEINKAISSVSYLNEIKYKKHWDDTLELLVILKSSCRVILSAKTKDDKKIVRKNIEQCIGQMALCLELHVLCSDDNESLI